MEKRMDRPRMATTFADARDTCMLQEGPAMVPGAGCSTYGTALPHGCMAGAHPRLLPVLFL